MKELQPKLLKTETTWVIDAYYEAIVAKRPKLLYRIGWDALLIFYPFSILPLRLQLYVIKFMAYVSGLSATTAKNVRSEMTESKND
ncbi:hypothetical protein X798_04653 [Onchocerca flexuosa]|uniref:Bestrophin homolog n=2 Tax=Onchocerca flexuosa TaxID=387005 RepID=A0A183I2Q9_9BILA|nr:hypothetical protein X798_04653 [Onchocerca flexuosa]VDP15287.1 unnamed protein product [Onchocerca flexuosa]